MRPAKLTKRTDRRGRTYWEEPNKDAPLIELHRIQMALNTEEVGEALVDVARLAHQANLILIELDDLLQKSGMSVGELVVQLRKSKKSKLGR